MILKQLKARTENLHRQVEEDNLASHILDHSIKPMQYEQLLIQNYRAYATLEHFLKENKEVLPEELQSFIDGKKTAAIAEDLKHFRTAPPERTSDFKPETVSPEALIGILYVIEGSMLGGLMIQQHLDSCEGLRDIRHHHFFGGDPKESIARWRSFMKAVNSKEYTHGEIDEAVDAAHEAFALFGKMYTAG